MQVAQAQVDEARKLSADAERKLAETKVMEVERMSQYVQSLENNDEEEVPEAYLREDWNNHPEVARETFFFFKLQRKECSFLLFCAWTSDQHKYVFFFTLHCIRFAV